MKMPLPYTPQTVARIRAAAVMMSVNELATSIGWDVPRLERIAKQHSIELRGAKNGATETAVPKKTALVPAPPPLVRASRKPVEITSSMTLDEIADALGPETRHGRLFEQLIEGGVNRTPPIPASELLKCCGISRTALGAYLATLRLRLRPTRWTIEGTKGREGGYRLATVDGVDR